MKCVSCGLCWKHHHSSEKGTTKHGTRTSLLSRDRSRGAPVLGRSAPRRAASCCASAPPSRRTRALPSRQRPRTRPVRTRARTHTAAQRTLRTSARSGAGVAATRASPPRCLPHSAAAAAEPPCEVVRKRTMKKASLVSFSFAREALRDHHLERCFFAFLSLSLSLSLSRGQAVGGPRGASATARVQPQYRSLDSPLGVSESVSGFRLSESFMKSTRTVGVRWNDRSSESFGNTMGVPRRDICKSNPVWDAGASGS